LLPEEELVVPTIHKHWIILVRPFVIPVLIALVIAVVLNTLVAGPIDRTTRGIITFALGAGALLWALGAWLVRLTSTLTLTNQRVIQAEGVLSRFSNVIPIDRIQDISIKQSVIGRLLSYGDIEIDTAGVVANEVFTYVPQPETFRDQLFVTSTQRRRPSSGV
jgi:uncharacterized membrane protein YdbT with pleckstrin-like domain